MSVDFAKLNKPGLGSGSFGIKQKNSSVSAQAAKNLANSSAATKKSIFSNTRSPNFVAGHNVAKQSSRYSYQGARMRANAPFVPRHTGYSGGVGHAIPKFEMPGQSGLEKFTQTMQQAVLLGQTIQAGVGVISGLFGGTSASSALSTGVDGLTSQNAGQSAALSTMTGQLFAANSFTDINNMQTQMNAKKTSLNTDYQTIGTTAQSAISQILSDQSTAQGLSDAGVNVKNLPSLSNPIDISDLGNAETQVTTDIGNIQSFANGLNTDIGTINSKKSATAETIKSKTITLEQLKANNPSDPQITALQNEIQALEKQKANFEKAEQALKDVQSQCGTMVDDLKTKQSEIKDLKNAEEQLAQKKYDLAKSQEAELNNLMKKIDKLNKDSSKNANEISVLKQQVGKIVQSFTAANATTIANPKGGQAINLTDAINKAKAYM